MGALPPAPLAARFPRPRLVAAGWAVRGTQVGLVAAAATLYALVLGGAPSHHQDLDTYVQAARDIWLGPDLFGPFLKHPFPDPTLRPAYIYPPLFALVVAPLALVPAPVAVGVWLLTTQAALAFSMFLVLRHLRAPRSAVVASIVGSLTFFPLWVDAIQGQANLVILLLVTLGLLGVTSAHSRSGSWLGLAAALKVTPALLLGWLSWERRFAAAAWMIFGFVFATAIGAVIRSEDTLAFFGQVAPALARGTAFYGNQSLSGVLARLFSANPYTQPWVSLPWEWAVWVVASGLLVGFWLWHGKSERNGINRGLSFLPLLPLLSAVTWPHHLVLLLPLLWLCTTHLARRGWPLRESIVLLLVALLLSAVPHWHGGPAPGSTAFRIAQTEDPFVLLSANSLFLGTLVLFLTSPWLLRALRA